MRHASRRERYRGSHLGRRRLPAGGRRPAALLGLFIPPHPPGRINFSYNCLHLIADGFVGCDTLSFDRQLYRRQSPGLAGHLLGEGSPRPTPVLPHLLSRRG